MNLHTWALRWGVGFAALADLKAQMGLDDPPAAPATAGHSEAWVQASLRLEASTKGARLWRNNVGALLDDRGIPVRFGLANDNKLVNDRIKSADLIGIRPLTVTPEHLGRTIGQFISREVKAPGWRYTGAGREPQQLAWANLITSLGGDAQFATSTGTI